MISYRIINGSLNILFKKKLFILSYNSMNCEMVFIALEKRDFWMITSSQKKENYASIFPHWFVETLIKLHCRQFVIPNHAVARSQSVLTAGHEKSLLASGSHTFADVVTHADVGQWEQGWLSLTHTLTMIC